MYHRLVGRLKYTYLKFFINISCSWRRHEEAFWRCLAHSGGCGWGGQGVPVAYPALCQESLLQGWQPHHQLHGGGLRGHPPWCCSHVLEHCIQRGREGRFVALHLRPCGSLQRWNQAGSKDELRRPQRMAGGQPRSPDSISLQGHSQSRPESGRPCGPGEARLRAIENWQHCTRLAARTSAGCDAGAWWITCTESGGGGHGQGGRGANRGQRSNRGRVRSNRSYPYSKA